MMTTQMIDVALATVEGMREGLVKSAEQYGDDSTLTLRQIIDLLDKCADGVRALPAAS